MADCLDSGNHEEQETSDECHNPFCEPCQEASGKNVRMFKYCNDCVQFLCIECFEVHAKLQGTKNHSIADKDSTPRSHEEKPPRYDYCDNHPKHRKDMFCCDHKILLCALCAASNHTTCFVDKVENVCKAVNNSDTDKLYDNIKKLQESLKTTTSALETNIGDIDDRKKTMLKDAQLVYDKLICEINKLYDVTKTRIETDCQSQASVLSQHKRVINDFKMKLESQLAKVKDMKGKSIDSKMFLRLQEVVTYTNKSTEGIEDMFKSVNRVTISFVIEEPVQKLLSSTTALGSVCVSESPVAPISVPDFMFQIASRQQQSVLTAVPSQAPTLQQSTVKQNVSAASYHTAKPFLPESQIKASKLSTHNVRMKGDNMCNIVGISVTTDGKSILVDRANDRVKLLSVNMEILSHLSVPGTPRDVAVIDDNTAAVSTDTSLVILDISGQQMRVQTTTQIPFGIRGICKYKGKLVATCFNTRPPSVKLLDLTGKECWSVSVDQQGQPLFCHPRYVTSHCGGSTTSVVVSDNKLRILTLLNGENGTIVTRHPFTWPTPSPGGVTMDHAGNIYVSFWKTRAILVFSGDLVTHATLLSKRDDIKSLPKAIAYDEITQQLIVSYHNIFDRNIVDRLKIM